MENTDIDMVISIPDSPDRAVQRGSISREVKRSPHFPEEPLRYQREEYSNYLNGGTRPVPETGEIRENSDTETEDRHRSRASGSNSLFRRTAVEKDKGKSICTDPRATWVEGDPVVNLNQHNGHAHVTASRCLPSEDIREFCTSNLCSSLRGDHNSYKLSGNSNKSKGKVDCIPVSNRETIDLSRDKQQNRGTKRLVRYGCISPHRIEARAKKAADTNSKDIVSVEQEKAPETSSSICIRENVSENDIHERARGKRSDISHSRIASRDAIGSEAEGWISTHNPKLNIGYEMNCRDESDSQGICSSVSKLDFDEIGAVGREARQQRQKNGLTSLMASSEPEVSVIISSGEPSSSRPPRIDNHQRHGTQVLEDEDTSPEVQIFRGPRLVENNESDLKVRQIEADEILARELQEQLYQEASVVRDNQSDENLARLLEQEENSARAFARNTIAANPGGRSRLEARLQQHSSRRQMNPQQTRASVRAPPWGRGQLLGRAPRSPHRALNLSFPNDMDLESRLDYLEEIENVIGHSDNNSNLLHIDRDFTEDDYELLLALDENNHRHGGVGTHGLNNLPESIVQTDNFQETCVICLETPTIGDTIRHLPCFHKFHKDCVDPWLRRSKSCPVCKFSVT